MRLAVLHNLWFYNELTDRIRQALDQGCFPGVRRMYSQKLDGRD